VLTLSAFLKRVDSQKMSSKLLEKCFDLDFLYLTAQTMFRNLPASTQSGEYLVSANVFEWGLQLRRRLFYVGLLGGHIPSALCLWWSFSYNILPGQIEKDMILRCLDDARVNSLETKFNILAKVVKADAEGDVFTASNLFAKLDKKDLAGFDLLWKKRVEYLFAMDEEAAFAMIRVGSAWFSTPMIVHALEQFLDYTKNEDMKIRIAITLNSYSPKYTFNTIAQRYEQKGDIMMAREYHEIAAASGDEQSQVWMIDYFGTKSQGSHVEFWKGVLSRKTQEGEKQQHTS
jgi:hypothetical protein